MKNRLLLITLLITVALTGKTKKVATELPTSTKTETDATPKPVKSEEMPVESEIPTDEPVKRSETYEKPEIYMVEPIFRTGSDGTTVGKWPCGGPVKGKGHMLVSPASTTFFQWKIVKGTPEGNCTVSIGPGVGTVDDWVKMAPRDGSADPHTMKFPCGRNDRSHETKWFVMPEDMKCDDCTIQLVWETVNGEIYQCSDLALMDADDAAPCIGKCQNGGACVNGYCRCPENYLGKYCESRGTLYIYIYIYIVATSSKNGWMWLLFIALFLLIILLFACAYHMIKVYIYIYIIWYLEST